MNSSLYGKEYIVPNNIVSILQKQGSRRSNNLVSNGKISYSLLKKMKSDIDNGISDYGSSVETWVNNQLRNSRSDVHDIKKNQMNSGMMNRFKKAHTKDKNAKPTQPSGIDTTHNEFMRESINSHGKKVIRLTESELKELIENVINEEQYDIFNDPKAIALVDYLNDKYELTNEYGLMNIEYEPPSQENSIGVYTTNNRSNDVGFYIFTDDELNDAKNFMDFLGGKITKIGDYNIVD
ncbi:hypothetical protein COB55_03600 [Candidatus Wolfebacteria bacterium]|nr:MAG: hypothetical protein COB55_03600 [Candidatus Wolfebacteria bacterium]